MHSSASAKALGSFGVTSIIESAKRVAEEKGIKSGSGKKLWKSMKARVHGLSSQVQETFADKRATSSRRSTGDRSRSASQRSKSALSAVDDDLVKQICELEVFNSRASECAVRLALSKSRGADNNQKMQIACDWLLDEKNVEEIEAAENAEIERITAAQEVPAASTVTPSEERLFSPPTRQTRRVSTGSASDDGRGLGFFMKRRSFSSPHNPCEPSPRKVPMPGRLSRGSFGSRVSVGSANSGEEESRPSRTARVSIGSQTSTGSEAKSLISPRSTHSDDVAESEEVAKLGEACDAVAVQEEDQQEERQATVCEEEQREERKENMEAEEVEKEEDEEDEEDSEQEVFVLNVQPPQSACWDWPLSRNEKKARVDLIEKQMSAMDREKLKEELRGVRSHLRKMSIGGDGQEARKPSRLST